MKLNNYLKDKAISIIITIFIVCFSILLLLAFKTEKEAIIVVSIIFLLNYFLFLLFDFLKRKIYYDDILKRLEQLDKKYLISEIIDKPNFVDGEILYDVIYEVDKSMHEKINLYENNLVDFKDFIEMWIHEVKIPLSGIYLMLHNSKKVDYKLVEQVKRLEDQVEQVLYYVRCENAESDYLIKDTKLKTVVSKVAIKNKEFFLNHKVQLICSELEEVVLTDAKWLEFIINQIVNNSLKYLKKGNDSYIKIESKTINDFTSIIIEDNGLGIIKSDLDKVFNKSFTGENGRLRNSSTGMGLYIVKSLCDRLGHKIEIDSVKDKYTRVIITFSKKSIYDVVR